MPIRSRMLGILDEADLQMLENVLASCSTESDEDRNNRALEIIELFQSGVTDPQELQRLLDARN